MLPIDTILRHWPKFVGQMTTHKWVALMYSGDYGKARVVNPTCGCDIQSFGEFATRGESYDYSRI